MVKVIPPTPSPESLTSQPFNVQKDEKDGLYEDIPKHEDIDLVAKELVESYDSCDEEEENEASFKVACELVSCANHCGNDNANDIIDGFEIYIDHEEILNSDFDSCENTSIDVLIPLENAEINTNVKLDANESSTQGSDHTYAGMKCDACDSKRDVCDNGTFPMTPISTASVEISTDNPSIIESSCSPFVTGTSDANTIVKINTIDIACSPCYHYRAEQDTMTDPMTPVRGPDTCDISVQHLIDTVSSACSPVIPDMPSMACSPIPSSLTADYTDTCCSPAFQSQTTESCTMTNATPIKCESGSQV